ncbi:MAG: phosphate butyryltransferase, partial [Bacteroidales bacterium]|nr:phosphate butyryltransferase [Bacteroidales bacterium]
MGAKVPCVLSSRGDSSKTKLYSIALAAALAK